MVLKNIDRVYKLMLLPIVIIYSVASGGLDDVGIKIGCIFDALFSVNCWGCGLTRSIVALVHGNFEEVIRFHAAGPAVLLIISSISFAQYYRLLIPRS